MVLKFKHVIVFFFYIKHINLHVQAISYLTKLTKLIFIIYKQKREILEELWIDPSHLYIHVYLFLSTIYETKSELRNK